MSLNITSKHLKFLLRLASCVLILDTACGQTIDSSAYKQYAFIKKDLNHIENDSTSLTSFYEHLLQLEQKKITRVNITHIGDSHIQADILSGSIRQKLQLRFGNAGRGLVFPYRSAKSNEPTSYKTITNVPWNYKRNVFFENPLPIGISGFTIETNDSLAEINLLVKDQPKLGYSFTKFTLFHEKGLNDFDITICDDMNCQRGIFKSTDKSANPFVSELKFDKPIRQIYIRNRCSDTLIQKTSRIYGMLLENDSSGVLYNMIGVNGAEYRHYVMSKYFTQQLTYLNSNLIIISLGTNEAFSMGFDKDFFYKSIDSLVTRVKLTNPNACILITTPADSYRKSRKGRVKNPDMRLAKETVINYCLQNNIAYWNLYDIMGGFGSMGKWYSMKLTAKDRVHFSGKGYQIQGDLFYNALMEGFEKYKKKQK
ncbi:MAG: GDSL-type esterase/lipase family protein [Bacteroidetes bacterium]|nr:GDSL-type esterase/lipase family protein [Bacteroidota bacterium]